MDIKVRHLSTDEDFKEICTWWEKYPNWEPVHPEVLPPIGFIATLDGERLAACWVYTTDSCIAWLEYIVGNPFIEKELRSRALNACIAEASRDALDCGAKTVFTSSNNSRLIERLKELGFIEGDKDVTQLIFNGG
jgi:hypothetical protein